MTFAEKLRELRDEKGLSEAKLADLSGLPFGTVHVYGLSRRKPSLASVVKLPAALGVTGEAFAGCDDGADEKPAKPTKRKKCPPPAPASRLPRVLPPHPPPPPAPRSARRRDRRRSVCGAKF